MRLSSQETVSSRSKRSVFMLQLSSMPLPTTSIAPGLTFSGSAPQRPALSQQSPSLASQPSPSQSVVALLQTVQAPFTQLEPAAHFVPHIPQLFASVWRLVHVLPHCVNGELHAPMSTHCPAAQSCPLAHTLL